MDNMIIESVVKENGVTTIIGNFPMTAGRFVLVKEGDGNSAEFDFTFSGGQYDINGGPKCFSITGEWEMEEVAGVCRMALDGVSV